MSALGQKPTYAVHHVRCTPGGHLLVQTNRALLCVKRHSTEPNNPFCIPLLTGGRAKKHRRQEMPTASPVETRETASLIGSDKVEGTAVYGADEQKIGEIERVMIEKVGGKVAFAVLSFGGFLGIGEDYYPVPWPS